MRQTSLNLRRQKHSHKCKVHVILFLVTVPLLCIQLSLYQRHRKIHKEKVEKAALATSKDNEKTRLLSLGQSDLSSFKNKPDVVASNTNIEPISKKVSEKHDEIPPNVNDETQPQQEMDESSHLIAALPEWIRNYMAWHKSMREKFPGRKLFEDPDAPKLLVRTCLGLCGGLNDRLGQLPWDLYLANQTNRVLLLHWHRPVPLERFLVPNGFDWTVPPDMPGFFPSPKQRTMNRKELMTFRDNTTDFFEGYPADRPTLEFWSTDFVAAIERANTGSFASKKFLRHRLLGHLHESVLEERLRELGETDMIHHTATFGNIFHLFFKLADPVQEIVDEVYNSLNLQAGEYSAVHCRVRHPKAFVGLVKGKNENYTADKSGLPWEGETRQSAIQTAVRAVKCAQTLQDHHPDPIYFFSDSNDLVRYMSNELYNQTYLSTHQVDFTTSETDKKALDLAKQVKVLARPSDQVNAHIDRQKGRFPFAYYGTFVDLFLAINARCVTYGVGFYAVFATKISHTPCKLLYQEEAWGANGRKGLDVPVCELEADS